MRAGFALLAGALLLCVGRAEGAHDGPEVVETLGWDAGSQTAYFRIHHMNESGYLPTVVSLVRDSLPGNPRPVAHPRSIRRTLGDQAYESWIDSLRQSLTPLVAEPAPALFPPPEILHADTLNAPHGRFPTFVVRVRDPLIGDFIVENVLCTPRVVMVRRYRSPDESLRIGVLAFQAIPWELCYEVQVPIAIPPAGPVRVRWVWWQ